MAKQDENKAEVVRLTVRPQFLFVRGGLSERRKSLVVQARLRKSGGSHVGEGKKSVAVAVTLQPQHKTLTDEDIDKVAAAVVAAIEKATGGVLRA